MHTIACRASRRFHFIAALLGAFVVLGVAEQQSMAQIPPGFVDQIVLTGVSQPVGLTFGPDGRMYVTDKSGRIWWMPPGGTQLRMLISITTEVYNFHDHGLLGFALDPDYLGNRPFIYLLYAVDFAHLIANENENGQFYPMGPQDVVHDTIGRLTRYRVLNPASDNPTVDYSSRTILIGSWSTRRDAAGVLMPPHETDGFALTGGSHGMGALVFAKDGTLLVSAGDGGMWNGPDYGFGNRLSTFSSNTAEIDYLRPKERIGAYRAQLVDCHSGKILRINPDTGSGIPGNPYYDTVNPMAPRSRVWCLGLRNVFRFGIKPGTGSKDADDGDVGTLYIGDVGWGWWEEISIADSGGINFGWPMYEGLTLSRSSPSWNPPSYHDAEIANLDAPNPLFDGANCADPHFFFKDIVVQETLGPVSFPNPCNPGVQIPDQYTYMQRRPPIEWYHLSPVTRVASFSGTNATETNIADHCAGCQPFRGSCVIGGDWCDSHLFPPSYRGSYFVGDAWYGWIRAAQFDDDDKLVRVRDLFALSGSTPVAVAFGPDGVLYYIRLAGQIRRIFYDCNGDGLPGGEAADCNGNGEADDCDLAYGVSFDCNVNLAADDCEADHDCNGNLVPDECEGSGDADFDCIVDLSEYASLVACVTGPNGSYAAVTSCIYFDKDADSDVDLHDLGAFQRAFGNPPSNCTHSGDPCAP